MTYERKIVKRPKLSPIERLIWRDAWRRRLRWPFSVLAPEIEPGPWR